MKKAVGITLGLFGAIIVLWWVVNLDSLLIAVKFLFVTDKNKMNWIGLTGIIAIVGLVYNLYDGRRRFRGDIRSKSRIDWMKTVREIVAEFLSDYQLIVYLINHPDVKAVKDQYVLATRVSKNYYEIMLYVPDNESNALLLNNIKELFRYFDDDNMSVKGKGSELDELIAKTIKDSSKYFKDEWEEAKKGK